MMLMKAPTGGGTSTGAGRDVIFRLTVQPDPNAARITREFGDGMTRVHNMGAGVAQQRAKDISDFYRSAFDDVLRHGSSVFESLADRSRIMAGRIASDWSNAMRGIGGPGGGSVGGIGGSSGPSGFQMNMAGLAASRAPVYTPSPWPSMGGSPAPWAPPPGMAGLGFGTPRWQSPVAWPSMSGSGTAAPGIGGGGGGGGAGSGRFNSRGLEAINNLFHGGTHLARGVAYSGLVGEQDSQKMVDALLRIEGTLGLIYGAVSIGKGLGALGLIGGAGAAAAASVALAGATAYDIFSDPTVTGKSRNLGSQTQNLGWYNPGRWAYGWGTGDGRTDGRNRGYISDQDAAAAYAGLAGSVKRAGSQEEYLTKAEKDRRWRMGEDAAASSSAFSENDRLAEIGMRGVRTNEGRSVQLAKQLALEEETKAGILAREMMAQKQGGEEVLALTRQREDAEGRIYRIKEQQREIALDAERQVAALAMNRAQRGIGIAQQGLSAQGGLAMSAAGRLRADRVRFGQLSPLERMRTESAFAAVKAGNATKEQEQLAGGYNAFSGAVEAKQAQRGMSPWFDELRKEADESAKEFQSRAAEVAKAQLDVITQHEVTLKIDEKAGNEAAVKAGEQTIEFLKEMFASQDRDYAKKLDDLRREMDNKERKRDIVARR